MGRSCDPGLGSTLAIRIMPHLVVGVDKDRAIRVDHTRGQHQPATDIACQSSQQNIDFAHHTAGLNHNNAILVPNQLKSTNLRA